MEKSDNIMKKRDKKCLKTDIRVTRGLRHP